jgi:hypothetical protein
LHGCPRTVLSTTTTTAVEEETGEEPEDPVDAEFGARATVKHSAQINDNGTPGSNNGWVIFLIVFLALGGVVFAGIFVYAMYVQWPSKKKGGVVA